MSVTPMRRSLEFMRVFARRQAQQVVDVPGGFAVLDLEYAASYHHNRLFVTGTPEPAEILALAEQTLGGAGLGHRMVVVEDDDHGAACVSALAEAGYEHEVSVVMIATGPVVESDPTGVRVEPVDVDALAGSAWLEWRTRFPNAPDEVVRQLVERRVRTVTGADEVRFLAVRDVEGRVISRADLYLDPVTRTAQIEDLGTDQEHTRRGYAGAILAEARRRAETAGCDLVFLVADARDWPQHWYRRLGYAPVGTFHGFVRPIPDL